MNKKHKLFILLLGVERPLSTLQLVQIYFETATFDDIERDKKIKTEAQLSLIGGTMGLLTGFSIISGVEIIFFLFRLICPPTSSLAIIVDIIKNLSPHFRLVGTFRIRRSDDVVATKEKFGNSLLWRRRRFDVEN